MCQLGVIGRLHVQPPSFGSWSFVRKLSCAVVVTYLYDQWVLRLKIPWKSKEVQARAE